MNPYECMDNTRLTPALPSLLDRTFTSTTCSMTDSNRLRYPNCTSPVPPGKHTCQSARLISTRKAQLFSHSAYEAGRIRIYIALSMSMLILLSRILRLVKVFAVSMAPSAPYRKNSVIGFGSSCLENLLPIHRSLI